MYNKFNTSEPLKHNSNYARLLSTFSNINDFKDKINVLNIIYSTSDIMSIILSLRDKFRMLRKRYNRPKGI